MESGPHVSATMARTMANLREAGVPVAAFASVVGCPLSSMKAALRGNLYVGAITEADYLEVSARCRDFMSALYPLTFVDWAKLKELLASDKSPDEARAAITSVFGNRE
jgi:hypothetical protein